MDQEGGHQLEQDHLGSDDLAKTYTIDEFEVRVLEPEKSGVHWETKATISMQQSENALTARMVTLFVSLQGHFCYHFDVGMFRSFDIFFISFQLWIVFSCWGTAEYSL